MPSGDFTRPSAPRKPRTVNKGKSKTVAPPIPDIQTGTGYKAPKPAPAPKASWTKPLARADKPITQAQAKAQRRTAKVQRKSQKAVTIPYVPKLANPTAAQRGLATSLATQKLGGQSFTPSLLPPVQRKRFNRLMGYSQTRERNQLAAIGRLALPPGQRHGATVTQLAEIGKQIADWRRAEGQPGALPTKIQLAGFLPEVNLSAITGAVGSAVDNFTSLDGGDMGPRNLVNRSFNDVKILGTAPFLAAYQLGAGGVEALQGDTSRYEQLASGVAEGIKETVSDPGKYFSEHPLLGVLDVLGVGSIAGRGAGALARKTGMPVGSRVRPPVAFLDDPGAVGGNYKQRTYSPDLIRASLQRASDARRPRVLNEQGKPVTVRDRGKDVELVTPGAFQGDRYARRRGNYLSSRHTMTERYARDIEAAEREIKLRGKGRNWGSTEKMAQTLVVMTAEGQVLSARTMRRDLTNRLDRLKREYAARSNNGNAGWNHWGEKKQAEENMQFLVRALDSPKVLARAEEIAAEGIKHGKAMTKADKDLDALGMLPDRAGTAARMKHVAIEHLDARWDSEKEWIVAGPRTREVLPDFPEGTPIPYQRVEQFVRDEGRDPDTVAFLPAKSPGKRAWHAQLRPGTRPNLLKQTRTGEMYRKGATKTTPELLKEQGVRQQVLLNKAEQIDSMVGEHALAHPALAKALDGKPLTAYERKVVREGGDYTGPEAAKVIERAREDKNQKLVAVTAHPARGLSNETRMLIKKGQGSQPTEGLSGRLLNDRFLEEGSLKDHAARNVRLMPEELYDQLVAQLAPAGGVIKALQVMNRPFRMAVLPQPRWLTGNFVEPYFFRLPTVGKGVINLPGMGMDILVAQKIARSARNNPAERKLAKEIYGQMFGGMLLGGRGASVHRSRDDFKTYGRLVEKFPIVEQIADLGAMASKVLLWPAEQFFRANRGGVEQPLQKMAFGKQAREDLREMQKGFLKSVRLSEDALADLKKGLVNTPTQERFMRAQWELLGQYDGYGPFMRQIIQGPAPFIPWALSAARFVYWTMPAHRTATTALLVRTAAVFEDQWAEDHADLSPKQRRGLGGAARRKDGGLVDLERYSPYGLTGPMARGDISGIAEQLLPQLRGAMEAATGKNPFGEDLRGAATPDNPEGNVNPLAQAFYGLLESSVPYMGLTRRVLEGGETGYDNSRLPPFGKISTKPGTSHGMSGWERALSPIRPVYIRKEGETVGGDDPVAIMEEALQDALGSDEMDAMDEALREAMGQ